MEKYDNLIGKYLNGYKIVKIENDPFIKGQINLWTDEQTIKAFGDRSIVKFFIREESNSAKIYQELVDKRIYDLKQALNKIKQYVEKFVPIDEDTILMREGQRNCILQIIDKVLKDEVEE